MERTTGAASNPNDPQRYYEFVHFLTPKCWDAVLCRYKQVKLFRTDIGEHGCLKQEWRLAVIFVAKFWHLEQGEYRDMDKHQSIQFKTETFL